MQPVLINHLPGFSDIAPFRKFAVQPGREASWAYGFCWIASLGILRQNIESSFGNFRTCIEQLCFDHDASPLTLKPLLFSSGEEDAEVPHLQSMQLQAMPRQLLDAHESYA